MARTTKYELEQQLIASQQDNAALRLALSQERANVQSLRTLLHNAERAEQHRAELQAWPTVKQHLAERKVPAHFAAAREAAMRLGRSVKVGG